MGKASKKNPKKSKEIPLECTKEEYDDLREQVAELSASEAGEELLECARYGEADAVRAILEKFPKIVDASDESGSTALHKACANGHVSTASLLIQNGAKLTTNHSGNTPLHWAAASGHDGVIRLLLEESSFDIDVLQKNEFGRSILTEGFSSENTQVVKLLLEHDSATEEKLLAGGEEVDVNEGKEQSSGTQSRSLPREKKSTIIHDFSLCDDPDEYHKPLRIRELVSIVNHFVSCRWRIHILT